jgi:FtsP/CotA-like multicopper oxidase with cupredoxin domain
LDTFVYEFGLKESGSFMYHPHSDEMVQMTMGMMGMFDVHPRDPKLYRADRDFVFIMSAYDIDPDLSAQGLGYYGLQHVDVEQPSLRWHRPAACAPQ